MGTVILISTVAIIVAIVGCTVIWRMDAARAEEIERPVPPAPARQALGCRAAGAPALARGLRPHGAGAPVPPARVSLANHPRGRFEVTTSVDTDLTGGNTMGLDDKIDNKAEELKGKAKEATGKATDDEQMEAEGKGDQAGANLKQAGEKIKDVFKG